MPISVIDLFAGPGGLNEGFSQVVDAHGCRSFKIIASVECNAWAHRTLELRALFRRLREAGDTRKYYRYLTGELTRQELFDSVGDVGATVRREAMCATLGESASKNIEIEDSIATALKAAGGDDCILIGGPPCQAYSVAGRARRTNEQRDEFEKDHKHLLYKQYLRLVKRFRPAVFLMENVPGLLSAKHSGSKMFELICDDLREAGYDLEPINASQSRELPLDDPQSFVVKADEFGVPQARSRVFILGLRKDLNLKPVSLKPSIVDRVTVKQALGDLPKIRSRLTREVDTGVNWLTAIKELKKYEFVHLDPNFRSALFDGLERVNPHYPTGGRPMRRIGDGPDRLRQWLIDPNFDFVVNHNSRGHMRKDLMRYFFWSQYAAFYGISPTVPKVPHFLRPHHENLNVVTNDLPFADRFRVQVRNQPATTIVSHIAKDGHYYIHYDSKQCRSLSVREAARLQTFPDNYLFEGPVTEQYHQVGNAVPPYLAVQIAHAVAAVLSGNVASRKIAGNKNGTEPDFDSNNDVGAQVYPRRLALTG